MRNVSGLEKETVRKGGEEERVRRLLDGEVEVRRVRMPAEELDSEPGSWTSRPKPKELESSNSAVASCVRCRARCAKGSGV